MSDFDFSDLNLDFLQSTPPKGPQGNDRIDSPIIKSELGIGLSAVGGKKVKSKKTLWAKKIASVDELLTEVKKLKCDKLELQAQLRDLQNSALTIQNLYATEKKASDRISKEIKQLQEKFERADGDLTVKNLKCDQLEGQLAIHKDRPVDYNVLAVKYLRVLNKLNEDEIQRNFTDRQLIENLRQYCAKYKLKAPPAVCPKQLKARRLQKVDTAVQCELLKDMPIVEKPETRSQGSQHISTMTTRGTTTACFIKYRTVGTSVPESQSMPVVDEILREFAPWQNITPISPLTDQLAISDTTKTFKSIGTCTWLCNIRRPIDFIPRHKQQRPQSALHSSACDVSESQSIKQEVTTPTPSPTPNVQTSVMSNQNNNATAAPQTTTPAVPPNQNLQTLLPLRNLSGSSFDGLWHIFGRMLLGLLQTSNAGIATNATATNQEAVNQQQFYGWLRQLYDSSVTSAAPTNGPEQSGETLTACNVATSPINLQRPESPIIVPEHTETLATHSVQRTSPLHFNQMSPFGSPNVIRPNPRRSCPSEDTGNPEENFMQPFVRETRLTSFQQPVQPTTKRNKHKILNEIQELFPEAKLSKSKRKALKRLLKTEKHKKKNNFKHIKNIDGSMSSSDSEAFNNFSNTMGHKEETAVDFLKGIFERDIDKVNHDFKSNIEILRVENIRNYKMETNSNKREVEMTSHHCSASKKNQQINNTVDLNIDDSVNFKKPKNVNKNFTFSKPKELLRETTKITNKKELYTSLFGESDTELEEDGENGDLEVLHGYPKENLSFVPTKNMKDNSQNYCISEVQTYNNHNDNNNLNENLTISRQDVKSCSSLEDLNFSDEDYSEDDIEISTNKNNLAETEKIKFDMPTSCSHNINISEENSGEDDVEISSKKTTSNCPQNSDSIEVSVCLSETEKIKYDKSISFSQNINISDEDSSEDDVEISTNNITSNCLQNSDSIVCLSETENIKGDKSISFSQNIDISEEDCSEDDMGITANKNTSNFLQICERNVIESSNATESDDNPTAFLQNLSISDEDYSEDDMMGITNINTPSCSQISDSKVCLPQIARTEGQTEEQHPCKNTSKCFDNSKSSSQNINISNKVYSEDDMDISTNKNTSNCLQMCERNVVEHSATAESRCDNRSTTFSQNMIFSDEDYNEDAAGISINKNTSKCSQICDSNASLSDTEEIKFNITKSLPRSINVSDEDYSEDDDSNFSQICERNMEPKDTAEGNCDDKSTTSSENINISNEQYSEDYDMGNSLRNNKFNSPEISQRASPSEMGKNKYDVNVPNGGKYRQIEGIESKEYVSGSSSDEEISVINISTDNTTIENNRRFIATTPNDELIIDDGAEEIAKLANTDNSLLVSDISKAKAILEIPQQSCQKQCTLINETETGNLEKSDLYPQSSIESLNVTTTNEISSLLSNTLYNEILSDSNIPLVLDAVLRDDCLMMETPTLEKQHTKCEHKRKSECQPEEQYPCINTSKCSQSSDSKVCLSESEKIKFDKSQKSSQNDIFSKDDTDMSTNKNTSNCSQMGDRYVVELSDTTESKCATFSQNKIFSDEDYNEDDMGISINKNTSKCSQISDSNTNSDSKSFPRNINDSDMYSTTNINTSKFLQICERNKKPADTTEGNCEDKPTTSSQKINILNGDYREDYDMGISLGKNKFISTEICQRTFTFEMGKNKCDVYVPNGDKDRKVESKEEVSGSSSDEEISVINISTDNTTIENDRRFIATTPNDELIIDDGAEEIAKLTNTDSSLLVTDISKSKAIAKIPQQPCQKQSIHINSETVNLEKSDLYPQSSIESLNVTSTNEISSLLNSTLYNDILSDSNIPLVIDDVLRDDGVMMETSNHEKQHKKRVRKRKNECQPEEQPPCKRSERLRARKNNASVNTVEIGKYTRVNRSSINALKSKFTTKEEELETVEKEQQPNIMMPVMQMGFFREICDNKTEEVNSKDKYQQGRRNEEEVITSNKSNHDINSSLAVELSPSTDDSCREINKIPANDESIKNAPEITEETVSIYKMHSKQAALVQANVKQKQLNIDTSSSNMDSLNYYESPLSPPPHEVVEENPSQTTTLDIPLELSPQYRPKSQANSLLENLISHYSPQQFNRIAAAYSKSGENTTQRETVILAKYESVLKDYCCSPMHLDPDIMASKIMAKLQQQHSIQYPLLCCAILKIAKNADASEIKEKELPSIIQEMPPRHLCLSLQRLFFLLKHLQNSNPTFCVDLLKKIDSTLFNIQQAEKITLNGSIHLIQLYLMSCKLIEQEFSQHPARFLIAKCLYFHALKSISMIHEILMWYPTVMPPKEDRTYDRSDPLITVIQQLLMSTKYDMDKADLRGKLLLSKLRFEYHYLPFKPSLDETISNLVEKIKMSKFCNLSLSFALLCKRMTPARTEILLQTHLLPLANEYFNQALKNTEFDDRISVILDVISKVVKPFPADWDVDVYLNIFSRFLSNFNRPIIQESAVCSIIRLQRFGYVNCFHRLISFKPTIEFSSPTQAILKTFIHRKPLYFLNTITKQSHVNFN